MPKVIPEYRASSCSFKSPSMPPKSIHIYRYCIYNSVPSNLPLLKTKIAI